MNLETWLGCFVGRVVGEGRVRGLCQILLASGWKCKSERSFFFLNLRVLFVAYFIIYLFYFILICFLQSITADGRVF